MQIENATVVVTGANRGIGAEFVRQLVERGAAKVYAAARDASAVDSSSPVVEAVTLDVTDPASIARAAGTASDATIVVNNAGTSTRVDLVDGDLDLVRREFETNAFGPLLVTRAFAPALRAAGGGAVLNVLSAASWSSFPGATTYAASKAAGWGVTEGLRLELAAQGTQVTALHMGLVDTDMTAGYPGDKLTPAAVVTAALDGLEAGAHEVLAADGTAQVKASLAEAPEARYGDLLRLA